MVKLALSEPGRSMTLEVFPEVAEEYKRTDTSKMTFDQKFDLIIQITEFLKENEKSENLPNG